MVGEMNVMYNSATSDSFKKHNDCQTGDRLRLVHILHFDPFSIGSKVILTSSEQLTMNCSPMPTRLSTVINEKQIKALYLCIETNTQSDASEINPMEYLTG